MSMQQRIRFKPRIAELVLGPMPISDRYNIVWYCTRTHTVLYKTDKNSSLPHGYIVRSKLDPNQARTKPNQAEHTGMVGYRTVSVWFRPFWTVRDFRQFSMAKLYWFLVGMVRDAPNQIVRDGSKNLGQILRPCALLYSRWLAKYIILNIVVESSNFTLTEVEECPGLCPSGSNGSKVKHKQLRPSQGCC